METPLLRTKFFIPPSRANLISRPRLIEQLNDGLHRTLTLVSAPAGFGKTTLLSEWASQVALPVSWLSLDKSDNDPMRYWIYFITALQMIFDGIGESVLAYADMRQHLPGILEIAF